MAKSMESYVEQGKTNVGDKLADAKKEAESVGQDIEGFKNGLSGMPGGLDADLAQAIADAEEQGRQEAQADIESIKDTIVRDAKSSADTIKSEVTEKINEYGTAQGKIDSISSKYGKAALDNATRALSDKTKTGNDLMADLEKEIQQADSDIESIKSGI